MHGLLTPAVRNITRTIDFLPLHIAESPPFKIRLGNNFLGAFTKLQKSDYQLRHVCLSIHPSVRMEQLCSHWTDFHKI
jgi:hypothetical protein